MEVEIGNVKEPAGLATIQTLGGTEEGKVFMICENLDGKGRSMEVMTSGFESTDNGKEFPIVNVIIALPWGE